MVKKLEWVEMAWLKCFFTDIRYNFETWLQWFPSKAALRRQGEHDPPRTGGESMKLKIAAVVALCLFAATTAFAQWTGEEEIEGDGTVNYIPVFTGSHRIGNSVIYQSNGNIGIGTTTARFPLDVFAGIGGPSPRTEPISILGELRDSTNAASAVEGLASATSGFTNGVSGINYSSDGNGVLGIGGLNGVAGQTNTTTGFVTGVFGASLGTSGPGVGVFGQAWSSGGVAGLFANVAGGDIIRGAINQPAVNVFRVDGTGRVFADGGFQPNGADFAESVAVTGDRGKYAPGDLLVIDPTTNRHLALATHPYSTLVAGIYSAKPGMLAHLPQYFG